MVVNMHFKSKQKTFTAVHDFSIYDVKVNFDTLRHDYLFRTARLHFLYFAWINRTT